MSLRTWEPGPHWKDEPGEYRLKRKAEKRQAKAKEATVMAEAKRRDGNRCRWPGCRWGDLRIEAAHVFQHRGIGGDPSGGRTTRDGLMGLCLRHHRLLDTGPLEIVALTERGTDGPCEFYDKGQLVARERSANVPEVRGA